MMLIFSIIVICSYVYSVVFFSWILKSKHFWEHLSAVAFKYGIHDMENNTWKFKLCSMFKHNLNGKGMVYGPNRV